MDDLATGTVAILAGGANRRMGHSKATLPFFGRPLVVWLAERFRHRAAKVVVVTAPGQSLHRGLDGKLPADARVVADLLAGRGPLSGLHGALRHAATPWVFVLACDYPLMDPRLMDLLCEAVRPSASPEDESGWDAAVPVVDGRVHPLAGIYRDTCLPVLEELLAGTRAGDKGPAAARFLDRLRVARVPERELQAVGDPGLLLFNMNTPADYRRAVELWPRHGSPLRPQGRGFAGGSSG